MQSMTGWVGLKQKAKERGALKALLVWQKAFEQILFLCSTGRSKGGLKKLIKMYLIDTNIFLEILLEREKWRDCIAVLKKIIDGYIVGFSSSFAIHSIELLLLSEGKTTELKKFLKEIASIENLFIYHTIIADEIRIIDLMKQTGLGFDDAIQYFVAKQFNCKAIISFDKHFDGLEIARKEPKEVLQ